MFTQMRRRVFSEVSHYRATAERGGALLYSNTPGWAPRAPRYCPQGRRSTRTARHLLLALRAPPPPGRPQMREHRVEVSHAEFEHERLIVASEVIRIFERGEDRQTFLLAPDAIRRIHNAEGVCILPPQRLGVLRAEEHPADPGHLLHDLPPERLSLRCTSFPSIPEPFPANISDLARCATDMCKTAVGRGLPYRTQPPPCLQRWT